jgi:hypothetical protein
MSIAFVSRNIVHSDHMLVNNVQLVSKPIQFATTFISILCGTLIANVHNHIYD